VVIRSSSESKGSHSREYFIKACDNSARMCLKQDNNGMKCVALLTLARTMNSCTTLCADCSNVSSSNVNGLAPSRRFKSFWNNSRLCVLRCAIADGAIFVPMKLLVIFGDGVDKFLTEILGYKGFIEPTTIQQLYGSVSSIQILFLSKIISVQTDQEILYKML
jgi:hypothetical protein